MSPTTGIGELKKRKTLCFSKAVLRHDIVIGLFVDRYELGATV
jgi:hypothetical protein